MRKYGMLLAAAAAVALATPAVAGTKFQSNLVPTLETTTVTLTPKKSKAQLKGNGKLLVKVQDLTDAGGTPITGDGSMKYVANQFTGTLTGDEYVAIVKGIFRDVDPNPGIGTPVQFEFNLPIELRNGKGKAKLDASALFSLIPAGAENFVEITGVDVWGPLGAANAAACEANVTDPALPGVSLPPAANPCKQGDRVATAGFVAGE